MSRHLRAVHEGELLVELREAHVVADGHPQPPRYTVAADELAARERLLALDQPDHRHVVQVDLAVGRPDGAARVDDDVRVVDALLALDPLLEATQREPHCVLLGELEVPLHHRAGQRLGGLLCLARRSADKREALREEDDLAAPADGVRDELRAAAKVGGHVVDRGHLDQPSSHLTRDGRHCARSRGCALFW
eukprot:scaffold82493_cov69-Phaeocystis_antarctica.AAC.4